MRRRLCSLILLVLLLSACTHGVPPDDGSPWPENHNGVYSSEYGSLVFCGDGESVTVELSPELAEATGLPEGTNEGNYVFLFQHGAWRYDRAERFRLTVGEQSYDFMNLFNRTDADTIAVVSPLNAEEEILFMRGETK